jgi:hypothetical protein
MVAALLLPRVLEIVADKPMMLLGGGFLTGGLFAGPWLGSFTSMVVLWAVLGCGFSIAQTPTGRLLRRSASAEDRPALFAAQFALSHSCWLITYPLAGQIGARFSLSSAYLILGAIALLGLGAAMVLWRRSPDREMQQRL